MFDWDDLDTDLPYKCINRVWAVSDIHTDNQKNFEFIERLDKNEFKDDVLIVAGDVSDDLTIMQNTLRVLKARFSRVFFVPGNHDLWMPRMKQGQRTPSTEVGDSLNKLVLIEQLCKSEAIDIFPARLNAKCNSEVFSVWIFPLLSWHCMSFDTEPDVDSRWKGIPEAHKLCADYTRCTWPSPLDHKNDSIAKSLDKMNDERMEQGSTAVKSRLHEIVQGSKEPGDVVISFSHFLPRIELLPEKRYLYYPTLAKFVGSQYLGSRVARLQPDVHIFGHTHFGWDQVVDGIRYMSPPVGMPPEREIRVSTVSLGDFLQPDMDPLHKDTPPKPVLVWDTLSGFPPKYDAGWSGFYAMYGREPYKVTTLPDYVAQMYSWDETTHGPKADVIGWEGKVPAWKLGPAWTQSRGRHY